MRSSAIAYGVITVVFIRLTAISRRGQTIYRIVCIGVIARVVSPTGDVACVIVRILVRDQRVGARGVAQTRKAV